MYFLSQDLFSLFSEILMRNEEIYPGIKGNNAYNLTYVDDTVLIAEKRPATICRMMS